MDIPPLAMWERAGALDTYEGVIRDLSHIDHDEVRRRIDRLSAARRRMLFRGICRAAIDHLEAGSP